MKWIGKNSGMGTSFSVTRVQLVQEWQFYFQASFLPVSYEVEEVVKGRLLNVIARHEKSTLILINVYAPVNPGERCVYFYREARKHASRMCFNRVGIHWCSGVARF